MQTPNTFGPVMLTSLERVAFYLGVDIGKGRVDGVSNDTPLQRQTRRTLIGWILDVSAQIQNHCSREFLIQEREQRYNVENERAEFFPTATPILSITEIAVDPEGQFTGAESVLDAASYRINAGAFSFEVMYGAIAGRNTLRSKLVGGLAYHGTQSLFAVTGVAGEETFSDGPIYAIGSLSEAVGRVVSYTAGTAPAAGDLAIDVFSGVFIPGEPLTFQSEIDAEDIDGVEATIASITKQSLCEAFPDIARAIEIEIRYLEKHAGDFENQSDGGMKSGATRRQPRRGDPLSGLQEETEKRLAPYVRHLVGT